MKKVLLSLIMLFTAAAIYAQSVPRDMVVLEITTSVKCTYCPGAAMGAEDLLQNGKHVAVIEHHNSWQGTDPFVTTASQARSTTLAPGGNPGAFFDVKLKLVGGNHTQSMYAQYLPKYNQRIAIPSPLTLAMDVTHTGLDYTAVITLNKVADITSTNLRLMFVVTQSHIKYSWQGQDSLHYVNRLMLPDANGTAISFSSGDTQTVTMNFSLDPSWPSEDCEIIAFLEDMTGKEVLNGMKRATVDLNPEFSASATSVMVNQPVTFTNLTTGGYMHAPETYQWIMPGATPETSTERNPTVFYADAGTYDVTMIVDRGGQVDTLIKPAYITSAFPVGIQQNIVLSTQVAPNPNNGIFTLDVFSSKTVTVNLSVVNSIGVAVYKETGLTFNNKMTKNIDLSNASKGVYFVILENDGIKTVKKIIIN